MLLNLGVRYWQLQYADFIGRMPSEAMITEAQFKKQAEFILETKNSINCGDSTRTSELQSYYNRLLTMIDQSLDMTYNITNVSCSFAKNDKNIFLNEADTGGIKGIGLCACSFLIGLLLGISILAGILLVHKYKLPSSNSRDTNMNRTDINESRENIKEGNNDQNPNMMNFQNK